MTDQPELDGKVLNKGFGHRACSDPLGRQFAAANQAPSDPMPDQQHHGDRDQHTEADVED